MALFAGKLGGDQRPSPVGVENTPDSQIRCPRTENHWSISLFSFLGMPAAGGLTMLLVRRARPRVTIISQLYTTPTSDTSKEK